LVRIQQVVNMLDNLLGKFFGHFLLQEPKVLVEQFVWQIRFSASSRTALSLLPHHAGHHPLDGA
jgi:hypothetical protein